MTQKELAKRLGFSEAYIWRVLNGRDNLILRNAKRIAKILGTEPNIWLRDGGTSKQRKKALKNFTEETA
jgi:transcriptional regulator with XRE-family HTH domain